MTSEPGSGWPEPRSHVHTTVAPCTAGPQRLPYRTAADYNPNMPPLSLEGGSHPPTFCTCNHVDVNSSHDPSLALRGNFWQRGLVRRLLR
jgi:hypothetical protein